MMSDGFCLTGILRNGYFYFPQVLSAYDLLLITEIIISNGTPAITTL
jgi:hypothetical protein